MNYVNDKFQQSFEIVAEKFLSKIRFGELIVTFPSGAVSYTHLTLPTSDLV